SAYAAAKPSRLSASTVAGELMSFFMSFLLGQASQPPRQIDDGVLQLPVSARIAEIGQRQRERPAARGPACGQQPALVRTLVGGQELAALGRREVADLENGVEMRG